MQKISAVIITYNEERNIGRCLASLAGITDEIVVVDSHSTDGTVQIAESYGARVVSQDFLGYAEQKNFANSLATCEFILSLDADEALSPKLREILLQERIQPLAMAYQMNRLTNYCGKWIHHSGWYPDKKVRLFHRDVAQWGGAKVHETLIFTSHIKPKSLDADIEHYSYYTFQEHIKQLDHFSSIAAKELFQKGKKAGYKKLLLAPYFRFLSHFLFKFGFLDGLAGYRIAKMEASGTFMKYFKLKELWEYNKRQKDQ